MRRLVAVFAAVSPLVAVLACGGRFDTIPGGDGGGSSSGGSSSGGGSGSGSGGSSGSSSGGTDRGCPAPASITNNVACSPDGLACPSNQTVTDCNGNPTGPITCVCEGGQWFCEGTGMGCAVCPSATDVVPGQSCGLPGTLLCRSDTPYYDCGGQVGGYLQCQCNGGQWFCPQPDPACPVDAGPGCPTPQSIAHGAPCSDPGAQCPGNPQVCDGQVDYDAFECQNGVWVDVAQTVCASDGGGPG